MTRGRFFRIAFVVVACLSLLLNAVVLGVGARLAERGAIGGGMARMYFEIPRDMRDLYKAALRAERLQLKRLAEEMRESRKTMLSIAGAKRVDPKALEAAMQKVRTATNRLQEAAHGVLLEAAARGVEEPPK